MAAETNTIMASNLAKVRSLDFGLQFTGSLKSFNDAIGVTRKLKVVDGTALKVIKVTGELQNGVVAEGELIPLSKYVTEDVTVGEIVLKKWRKATTAEAILKKGYDQAVGDTTDEMVKDIRKGIRADLISGLATGTGTASGAGLQAAVADAWGKLQTLWEDDAVNTVYFLNPQDVSAYLGSAQITMQNAFGMNYIENFLGMGTVVLNSGVPKGKFYATAKNNVVMYYVDVTDPALAQFELTADETGYIGISEYPDKDSARVVDLVMSGVTYFPERVDGIVVGTIAGE